MHTATKVVHRLATAPSGIPVTILAFTGDIASSSREAIMDAYGSHLPAAHKLLLDFSRVDYINSSGIAVIIQLLLEVRKNSDGRVGIFGLTAHFTKVFTMVGIEKYAKLSKDEGSALTQLDASQT